jgi:hypothetical protein
MEYIGTSRLTPWCHYSRCRAVVSLSRRSPPGGRVGIMRLEFSAQNAVPSKGPVTSRQRRTIMNHDDPSCGTPQPEEANFGLRPPGEEFTENK